MSKKIDIVNNNDTKELLKQLEAGVKELFESKQYARYLETMSKFHNYSAHNVLLILSQNPEASYVAGYQSWKTNFDRHVKAGEQAIQIIAPVTIEKEVLQDKLDTTTGKAILDASGNPIQEKVVINLKSFKVANVFDISQTEGKELPSLVTTLTHQIDRFPEIVNAIQESTPVPIEFAPLKKANGFYSVRDNKIVISDSLSEEQCLKTIFHELAHATMHAKESKKELDARTREVQAESVAYVICNHFGIDSSSYSFGYISSWSSDKSTKELKQSLSDIQKASEYLISNIEKQLLERNLIQKPKRKENTVCKSLQHKKNYKRDTLMR